MLNIQLKVSDANASCAGLRKQEGHLLLTYVSTYVGCETVMGSWVATTCRTGRRRTAAKQCSACAWILQRTTVLMTK